MNWNTNELQVLLSEHQGWSVESTELSIVIQNEDGINAFLAVSGEQILVEVLLFSQSDVKDKHALNETILRTHKMFPLSTIGINDVNGESYYTAFGSLSSQSKKESVVIEVATLFRNVEAFIDLYQEYL